MRYSARIPSLRWFATRPWLVVAVAVRRVAARLGMSTISASRWTFSSQGSTSSDSRRVRARPAFGLLRRGLARRHGDHHIDALADTARAGAGAKLEPFLEFWAVVSFAVLALAHVAHREEVRLVHQVSQRLENVRQPRSLASELFGFFDDSPPRRRFGTGEFEFAY